MSRIGRPLRRLIGVIGSLMLLTLPISALADADTSPSEIWSTYRYHECHRRLTDTDGRYVTEVNQQQLQQLYRDNIEFQDTLRQHPAALNDGVFGPITRQWLAYFCAEFRIPIATEHRRFVERLLVDLTRASHMNTLYPTWRSYIPPESLLYLTATELEAYLPDIGEPAGPIASPNPPPEYYYYRLTPEDLEHLAQRQTALESLSKLKTQRFARAALLTYELQIILTQLHLPPNAKTYELNDFVVSTTEETTSSTNSDTTSHQTHDNSSADTDTKKAASTALIIKSTSQAQTKTSTVQWKLNEKALDTLLEKNHVVLIPKDTLKHLETLENEVFASSYMFSLALKLTDILPGSPVGESIITTAKKRGYEPQQNNPLIWHPTPDCDCEDNKAPTDQASTFYGFYPYWHHPDDGQLINFSQMDRIGYVGATLKLDSSGPRLVLPPSWDVSRKSSQFVQTAHRYLTDVDLVVTTPRELKNYQLLQLFTPRIAEQLSANIQQPLSKQLTNRIHPLMTFGFSKVPTLGDGITLDLDLTDITDPDDQDAVFAFLRQLKSRLQANADPQTVTASINDRYYLNIIIPITALEKLAANTEVAETGNPKKEGTNLGAELTFYTFDNLYKLSEITNLMIMRPTTPDNNEEIPDGESEIATELQQVQYLQDWLNKQPDQTRTAKIYNQIVPLLITENNRHQQEELSKLIHFSSWSFLGGATWPIPIDENSDKLYAETFFPTPPSLSEPQETLLNTYDSLINWICPNRWMLRIMLLVVFLTIGAILLISLWYFPLRKFVLSLPFVGLSAAAILGLMLVFIADPYFVDYQGPIVLAFMLVIIAILIIVRLVRKERDKP